MKKTILAIGIITLFTISVVNPIVFGDNIKITNEKNNPTDINSYNNRFLSEYQHQRQNIDKPVDKKINFKSNFHPNQLIIKFIEDADINLSVSQGEFLSIGIQSIDFINKKYSVISAEKIFEDFSIPSLSSIYKFTFSKENINIYQIVKEYISDLNVEYAEPNYILQPNSLELSKEELMQLKPGSTGFIPNDPRFNDQWALDQTNDCDIDAPEAWDIETGSPDVVIAFVDSGIDYDHEDLKDNIWNNTDEIPDNGVDDDNNGFIDDTWGWNFVHDNNFPDDDYGHGTSCSGVAAAVTNNNIGIAGLCWNCKTMPIKTMDEEGSSLITCVSSGIIYAVENDADIISMSIGGYFPSQLLYDTIDYANEHGVVLVASAGNDNCDAKMIPASYDQVIAVSATNKDDKKAGFSNYGEWVDVAAPGENILTTIRDNAYKNRDGTSISCPYVAGLAALILSKHNPCPYPAQTVKSVIRYTTDEIETSRYIGTGRINAYKALTQQLFAFDLEAIYNWEDIKGTIEIKGTIWGEDLQYFVLEKGIGKNPDSWTELLNSSTQSSGVILSLDTTLLDEELYTIRLKAVYSYDTFTEYMSFYVNNIADGIYDADIYVSTCFDSSTPGWGITHFDSVQDGINATENGDTIFVHDGVYTEDVLITGGFVSPKSINLIGQNRNWTIIKGFVNITNSEKTIISGFTFRDGFGLDEWGIWYQVLLHSSSETTIAGCNIFNHVIDGILIEKSTNNIIKNNNVISTSGGSEYYRNGINLIESNENLITENVVAEQFHGIVSQTTFPYGFKEKNVVSNNTIVNNEQVGIILFANSSFNKISGNLIENNYEGILLTGFVGHTYKNTIIRNIIANNTEGISFCFGPNLNNQIIANNFLDNEYSGINVEEEMLPSFNHKHNLFYYNNFFRNFWNALDDGIDEKWYKSIGFLKGEGNYWDDYSGVDRNGDGFGDTPYIVHSITGKDYRDGFPFMEPVDINNVTIFYNSFKINLVRNGINHNIFLSLLERFPLLNLLLQRLTT